MNKCELDIYHTAVDRALSGVWDGMFGPISFFSQVQRIRNSSDSLIGLYFSPLDFFNRGVRILEQLSFVERVDDYWWRIKR